MRWNTMVIAAMEAVGGVGNGETTENYTIRDYILLYIFGFYRVLYVKMSFMPFIIRDGI